MRGARARTVWLPLHLLGPSGTLLASLKMFPQKAFSLATSVPGRKRSTARVWVPGRSPPQPAPQSAARLGAHRDPLDAGLRDLPPSDWGRTVVREGRSAYGGKISRLRLHGVPGASRRLPWAAEGGATIGSPLYRALRRRPSFYRRFSGGNLTAAGSTSFLRRIQGAGWRQSQKDPKARKRYLWI